MPNNPASNLTTREARLGKIVNTICILFQPPLDEQSRLSPSNLPTLGWGDGPLPGVSASVRADPGVPVCSPPSQAACHPLHTPQPWPCGGHLNLGKMTPCAAGGQQQPFAHNGCCLAESRAARGIPGTKENSSEDSAAQRICPASHEASRSRASQLSLLSATL